MKYTQDLEVGIIYYLYDYTGPKVFNGLYFECLVTDQKIAAHSKISTKTGKNIKDWDIQEIYKPERFGCFSLKLAIDFYFKQISKLSKEKSEHETNARIANENIMEIHNKVSSIRATCNHTYFGKKQTMMGRGNCDICGDSDY